MASMIDGLSGNRGVAIDNNLKPQADKSGQANTASATQTQAAAQSDTVALTAEAKSLQQLGKDVASQTEYFDQQRVDSIKKSISEGQYAVDSERVAEKFMATEQLLGKV